MSQPRWVVAGIKYLFALVVLHIHIFGIIYFVPQPYSTYLLIFIAAVGIGFTARRLKRRFGLRKLGRRPKI